MSQRTRVSNRPARLASRMCRMMGVVSRGPVYYDLFEEFADLATKGMCPIGAPDERGHKDGWGLACFQIGRAHAELQSPYDLVCRLLLEKKQVVELGDAAGAGAAPQARRARPALSRRRT